MEGHVEKTTTRLTKLLRAWQQGDERARDAIYPLVYEDLRRRARQQLAHERAGHTLRPSDIVHEAYIRLDELDQISWQNRAQFFGIAATIMRRILIDHARERASLKRGGDWQRTLRTPMELAKPASDVEILDLDEALDALGQLDPRKEKLVEMRFFGGFSIEEAAKVLDISLATAKRD